jgi:hypothetical protein
VWTDGAGLSLVNLRSNQVTNVETDDRLFGVVPYITYCIPSTYSTTAQISICWYLE